MGAITKKAGRHFSFLKTAGRHQNGAGRPALLKRPRQNTVEEGVTGKILKFADDTKLFRKTKEIGDKKKITR